jgi:outer membrane immunogenic protein
MPRHTLPMHSQGEGERHMNRVLGATVGLIALSALPAMAADLPMKAPPIAPMMAPAFSWNGCYLGGHVGAAWTNKDVTATDVNAYNGSVHGWSYKLDSNIIGGGTLGCNYQIGQFVLGVEGEGGYMSLRGSAVDPLSPFVPPDTVSTTRIGDWYAMATGRAGFAWDRALIYLKGGAAFVNTRVSVVDSVLQPVVGNTITATNEQVRATWTVGGGLEYALGGNWTVKGEYMFIGLNHTESACGIATIGAGRFCWNHDVPGIHTAKLGINYLFNTGGPLAARY